MKASEERTIKRTDSFFIEDLQVYQENQRKQEVVQQTIVATSMDKGVWNGVEKCTEVILRDEKMVKEEGLTVLEEKIKP